MFFLEPYNGDNLIDKVINKSPLMPATKTWSLPENIGVETSKCVSLNNTTCNGTVISQKDNTFEVYYNFIGKLECKGDRCACFEEKRILNPKACKFNGTQICCNVS